MWRRGSRNLYFENGRLVVVQRTRLVAVPGEPAGVGGTPPPTTRPFPRALVLRSPAQCQTSPPASTHFFRNVADAASWTAGALIATSGWRVPAEPGSRIRSSSP